jgi:molybdopterin/thiamine biosynthesis adenylyltransferase/rhodanese-related sulfurtransferase
MAKDQLSPNERARYARHIILPDVGEGGQKALRESSVMVIGAGGLGSPALLYLAAAGIGRIGIIDDDQVDISNLQRQVIHSTSDLGSLKSDSARRSISELNPEVDVVSYNTRLNVGNSLKLLSGWDIVIDGSDNFPTRYTISDACEILGTPWIFGSIHRFEGQVSVFNYNNGPNYRDLFPSAPSSDLAPNCAEAGVLGVLPGIIGTIQASEAIKMLLGIGKSLSGQLLVIDVKTMATRLLTYGKDTTRKPITEMSEELVMAACEPTQHPVDPTSSNTLEISPIDFVNKRAQGWKPFLLDVRRADEEAITSLQGTDLRIMHSEVPSKMQKLPRDNDIVVYCRTGVRSEAVVRFLSENGWSKENVYNLQGGIHLWSDTIDSSIIKY